VAAKVFAKTLEKLAKLLKHKIEEKALGSIIRILFYSRSNSFILDCKFWPM
jgi:hypothetical protein